MPIAVMVVGLIIGSAAVLTACFVWLRKQVFGTGGIVLSLVGVILIGLSIWSNVSIQFAEGRFSAEFNRLQAQLDEMAEAGIAVSEEVGTMWDVVQANSQQFVALTDNLEQRQTLTTNQARSLRTPVLDAPAVSRMRLDSARVKLATGRRPTPPDSTDSP